MKKIYCFLFGAHFIISCFVFLPSVFSQNVETITISTYYPAPYGVYRELRSQRMAIGDTYYDASQHCWGTGCTNEINADAALVVEGNVGIGTDDPRERLHVRGTTAETSRIEVQGVTPDLELYHDEADNGLAFRMGVNGNPRLLLIESDNNNDGQFTSDTSLVGITQTGNVGIGTGVQTPQTKLDVRGNAIITKDAALDTADFNARTLILGPRPDGVGLPSFGLQQDATHKAVMEYNYAPSLGVDGLGIGTFRGYEPNGRWTGSPPYSIFITKRGTVGMGTSSPAAKLDVNGEVRIGFSSPALACNSTTAGAMRYNSTGLAYCNGANWKKIKTE